MKVCAPIRAAATAWLAPFPPNPRAKLVPKTVSPGRGRRAARNVRSVFAEPTTQLREQREQLAAELRSEGA